MGGDSPDTASNHFRGVQLVQYSDRPHIREISQAERMEEASRHHKRFELLREAHKVRDFQLVLCANVWGPIGKYSVRMLRQAVADEKAKKGFDGFSSDPSVTCYLHMEPL